VAVILSLRPVQFIGAISFSLYLVHWPILVLAHERIGTDEPLGVSLGLAFVLASVPLAWLLYRFIETPFRTGERGEGTGQRGARTVLAASAAITLVVVGGLIVGGAAVSRLPLTSDRAGEQRVASALPPGTDFVPSNITPSLRAATSDTGEIYTNGCQQSRGESELLSCSFGDVDSTRVIALFGDSHAGRWFPALDGASTALGYRLDTFTKSGCRSEETASAWESGDNVSCSQWRREAVARLNANPPDVIVLANHLGPSPGRNPVIQEEDWTAGLSELLDRLPASSLIVTLADSPEFTSSPVVCLSDNLDEADACSASRAAALNPAIRGAQEAAAAQHGSVVVDLTDYFCNESTCPAVIGTTLVYSDEHHVTATFSRGLASALEQRLAPYLDRID
jgi:hypothetical protein